jgi:signal peptidase II
MKGDLRTNRIAGLLSFLIVLVLDQASKLWIVRTLEVGGKKTVGRFLDFVLVYNKGMSFGLFSQGPSWRIVVASAFAVLLALWFFRQYWQSENLFISFFLGFILGGAFGNFADRCLYGKVVDFIDCYIPQLNLPGGNVITDLHWPAFNIADLAIVLGVFAIFGLSLHRSVSKKAVRKK